jgi:hypothetical protein
MDRFWTEHNDRPADRDHSLRKLDLGRTARLLRSRRSHYWRRKRRLLFSGQPVRAYSLYRFRSISRGDSNFFPQSTGYWTIGSGDQFISDKSGELWLGINDDAVTQAAWDNAGSVTASVSVNTLTPYSVTINAHSNTVGVDVSVPITEDGAYTGLNTPHTFTGVTGSHTFTVAAFDANYHPFKQWDTGETTTTIIVSSEGTHTAYYEAVPYPPTYAIATPLNSAINVTWLPPATWYTVQDYYVYRSTSQDFIPWNMAPYATVNGNTLNYAKWQQNSLRDLALHP